MLGLIYRLFKIFIDGTGFIWESRWAMDLKLAINNQCSSYLVRLQQADNDSFAVLLRGLLFVAAIAICILSAISIKVGIFKALAANSMLFASCLLVYAMAVCDTLVEFWGKIKSLFKFVKWCFCAYCIVFVVALVIDQCYFNPVYVGKVLTENLVLEIAVNAAAQLPVKFYVISLLAFLTPFALLGIPFYANRWFVFPLLRKLIAKAVKEPFRFLSFMVLIGSTLKYIQSNVFK